MVSSACLVICFGCFSLCNSGLYFVQLSHCHCKTNYVKKKYYTGQHLKQRHIYLKKQGERGPMGSKGFPGVPGDKVSA